jgi:2-polyprenyl-3-methyl-5-hydroxy-6-metoxy-1,4-benzoquinol methylase
MLVLLKCKIVLIHILRKLLLLMKNKCRLCSTESSNTIEVQEMMFGMKESFEYIICDECNSMSLVTIPNNLADYYPENYYSFVKTERGNFKKWISNKKSASNLGDFNLVGFLATLITGKNSNLKAIRMCGANKNTSRVLDIGSGGGFLLDKLRDQGFKNILGIEPYLEKDIQEKGYKIKKETIEGLVESGSKFDIIILSHVFEHFEEPIKSVENMYKLLDTRGALILRTPICPNLTFRKYERHWFQIDAPRNILIPSFSGLKELFLQEGYDLQNYFFDSEGQQFSISQNYKKGIAMFSQKPVPYLQRIYNWLLAKFANLNNIGDQATFIFRKP